MMSSSCWNSLISHTRQTEGATLRVRGPKLAGANRGEGDGPSLDYQELAG